MQHISLSPDSIQSEEVRAAPQGRRALGPCTVGWEWAPSGCSGSRDALSGATLSAPQPLQAVAPLLKFLDEKLSQLSAALVKEGLSR